MIKSGVHAGNSHAILKDQEKRNEARRKKETSEEQFVRNQAEKECLAHGGHVVIEDVRSSYYGWDITCIVWRNDGVSVQQFRKIKFPDNLEKDDEMMRKAVIDSLKQFLIKQRKIAERLGLGTARITTVDEISLSSYVIEKPLQALLRQAAPKEAENYLKSKILNDMRYNNITMISIMREIGVENFEVELNRNALVCAFKTRTGNTTFRWARGSLFISGHDFPEQVLISMRLRRLGDILQHPAFDPEMIITSVDRTKRKGVDGITLNLKETTEEISTSW